MAKHYNIPLTSNMRKEVMKGVEELVAMEVSPGEAMQALTHTGLPLR